jgi:hypothetical protein
MGRNKKTNYMFFYLFMGLRLIPELYRNYTGTIKSESFAFFV